MFSLSCVRFCGEENKKMILKALVIASKFHRHRNLRRCVPWNMIFGPRFDRPDVNKVIATRSKFRCIVENQEVAVYEIALR